MSSTPAIRLRTYFRNGSETKLVEDRIIRPLTASERKSGLKDEYREYVQMHGHPGQSRRHPRKHAYIPEMGCGPDTELDLAFDSDGIPSEADQLSIYNMMYQHLRSVAMDLSASGLVSYSEIEDAIHDLFIVCCHALKGWMPERAGLKTYLYECVASATCDFARTMKRMKRSFSHPRVRIVSDTNEDDGCSADFSSVIGSDRVADRHALEKMIFDWALSDLEELLDPDETLALDYRLQDYPLEKVAEWMRCTYMQLRRRILQSLQMKAKICGFEPCNGEEV
jgi:RNA polymerase sigma factor (sigma-70 family)